MHSVARMRVLQVLLAVLSAAAFGAEKKIEGLAFDPTPGSGELEVAGAPQIIDRSRLNLDPLARTRSVAKP